jgi:hypothetical protein
LWNDISPNSIEEQWETPSPLRLHYLKHSSMHVFPLAPRRRRSERTETEVGVRLVQRYAVSIIISSIKWIAMIRVEDIARSWFVLNHALRGGGPVVICVLISVVLTVFPSIRKLSDHWIKHLEIRVNQSSELNW